MNSDFDDLKKQRELLEEAAREKRNDKWNKIKLEQEKTSLRLKNRKDIRHRFDEVVSKTLTSFGNAVFPYCELKGEEEIELRGFQDEIGWWALGYDTRVSAGPGEGSYTMWEKRVTVTLKLDKEDNPLHFTCTLPTVYDKSGGYISLKAHAELSEDGLVKTLKNLGSLYLDNMHNERKQQPGER